MREQWIAYKTIVNREVTRFMRIWLQTLLPPLVTQTLYFLIFGKFIGSQINPVQGVSYMAFIVPGLIMMAVINNAFTNVVSSFFSSKFQRNIEELLISPTSDWAIVTGYVTGGVLRGVIVGVLVFLISFFFTRPQVFSLSIIFLFTVLTAIVFSLGGLVNAIFAKKFDDVSIVPTFVLTPLTYLGGVFYSVHSLPPLARTISHFNPILYMVNGFRYGFFGFSDVSVTASVLILIVMAALLLGWSLYLLRTGTGLKS